MFPTLGLHEEGTGVKQPEMRKGHRVIQNGSGQCIRHKEEAENEGSWAKLKILNLILNTKGSHQKIINKKVQDQTFVTERLL